MKFTRHRFLLLAAGAAVLSTVSLAFSDRGAWSQTGRTIKIVVTFPKNSGASNLTQALADQIARAQGTIVVVENESAPTGTEAVAHAVRDGSTLLVINNNFVVDSHFRKPAYDPLADFEPICSLASAQTLVVVSGSSPYRTLVDLISAAREKPGEVTMAGNPRGTTHLGMEALR